MKAMCFYLLHQGKLHDHLIYIGTIQVELKGQGFNSHQMQQDVCPQEQFVKVCSQLTSAMNVGLGDVGWRRSSMGQC